MEFDDFLASTAHPAAPRSASGPLLALWTARRGDWDAAHDLVQADSPDHAWVHAWLHHEEGDLSNADYWYARAGRTRPALEPSVEWERIVRELLERAGSDASPRRP